RRIEFNTFTVLQAAILVEHTTIDALPDGGIVEPGNGAIRGEAGSGEGVLAPKDGGMGRGCKRQRQDGGNREYGSNHSFPWLTNGATEAGLSSHRFSAYRSYG